MSHPATTEDLQIGIEQDRRNRINERLGQCLADQHVLYIEMRNFHWNLRGPRFHSLHEFFEELYQKLEESIDSTAERIRMLGGVSPGSMAEFLQAASISETKGRLVDGDEAIQILIGDYEACVVKMREAIPEIEDKLGDVGTADFLTGLLREFEEAAWMLRSQQGQGA